MKLTYAIKNVADMKSAVAFHRDLLGLPLKLHSSEWSEFETGETTLALHLASDGNVAGETKAGFGSDDFDGFLAAAGDAVIGVHEVHGMRIATVRGPDGEEFSVSER